MELDNKRSLIALQGPKSVEILNKELLDSNRIDWFDEEQNIELKKSNIVTEPRSSWEKINLPSNLTTIQLNYLQKLSYWREDKAITNDIPKRWSLTCCHNNIALLIFR